MDHAVGWTWTGFGQWTVEGFLCLAEAVMLIEGARRWGQGTFSGHHTRFNLPGDVLGTTEAGSKASEDE